MDSKNFRKNKIGKNILIAGNKNSSIEEEDLKRPLENVDVYGREINMISNWESSSWKCSTDSDDGAVAASHCRRYPRSTTSSAEFIIIGGGSNIVGHKKLPRNALSANDIRNLDVEIQSEMVRVTKESQNTNYFEADNIPDEGDDEENVSKDDGNTILKKLQDNAWDDETKIDKTLTSVFNNNISFNTESMECKDLESEEDVDWDSEEDNSESNEDDDSVCDDDYDDDMDYRISLQVLRKEDIELIQYLMKIAKKYTFIENGVRSIEIFGGEFTSFTELYHLVCFEEDTTNESGQVTKSYPENYTKRYENQILDPKTVQNIHIVSCDHLITFQGLNTFSEVCQLACMDNPLLFSICWSDWEHLKSIKRIILTSNNISTIEPLSFQSLQLLNLAGNSIKSLNFLCSGELVNLTDLNIAKNEITHLEEELMFQCGSLQNLNLSGNPLCTLNDIKAMKFCKNLGNLRLKDEQWGECPVMDVENIWLVAIHFLSKISHLNGRSVYNEDKTSASEYLHSLATRYYASMVSITSAHFNLRQQAKTNTMNILQTIARRILKVANLQSKFLRVLETADMRLCPTMRKTIHSNINKLGTRLFNLNNWSKAVMTRLVKSIQISCWEEEVDKWTKWIDYQSYGSCKCQRSLSVLGETLQGSENLCDLIKELIARLACKSCDSSRVKVESIFTISDRCIDEGIDMYCRKYCRGTEYPPPFVPPPPEAYNYESAPPSLEVGPLLCYYNEPDVESYIPPGFKMSSGKYPGLPPPSPRIFLFLIPPRKMHPLQYLHYYFTGVKRHHEQNIRLTNCMCTAIQGRSDHSLLTPEFSVLIVVQVIENCLQIIDTNHQNESTCTVFGVTTSLALSVAYIIGVSIGPADHKIAWWTEAGNDDEDILSLFENDLNVFHSVGHKLPSYVRTVKNETHADLAAICGETNQTTNGDSTCTSKSSCSSQVPEKREFSFSTISKILASPIAKILTSLDISGNKLELISGITEGLANLRQLNISYNNLTTLSGITKLPNLKQLLIRSNNLTFLLSNITTLAWATPNLQYLDILPNPFQDIRDVQHIPILLGRVLPKLTRVETWEFPFNTHQKIADLFPPMIAESSLSQAVMNKSWSKIVRICIYSCRTFDKLHSRCLTNLHALPELPPFPCGSANLGFDLNLCDNYLTSASLLKCNFTIKDEWRTSLLKLQLQRNLINRLEWMKGVVFPNLQILNLSCNNLKDLTEIADSCPKLSHLYLSFNPLPSHPSILQQLQLLACLSTLDCSGSPLSQHPDYLHHVRRLFQNLKVLDGNPFFNDERYWKEKLIPKSGENLIGTNVLHASEGLQPSSEKEQVRKINLTSSRLHLMKVNEERGDALKQSLILSDA